MIIQLHSTDFSPSYLLWRDIERHGSEVHASVAVDAGNDGEDPGPLGPTLPEATQAEDDRSLVLGNNLEKPKGKLSVYLGKCISFNENF